MLSWWQSPEVIAKLGTIVAILIICLTGFGLALKLQSDRLKKQFEQTQITNQEKKTSELREELNKTKEKLTDSEKTITTLTVESGKAQKTIEDLNIKAKKAERGISSVYDFKGVKRDTTPGVFKATIGEETEVFKKMVNLEKEKKYPELSSLCKNQIDKTPEWLTPYLFLGVAAAKMGNKDIAISNFEHVLNIAPDDPDYQQAKEFIKMLKK